MDLPTAHLMYIEKRMWPQLSKSHLVAFVWESGSPLITAQNLLLTDAANSQSLCFSQARWQTSKDILFTHH